MYDSNKPLLVPAGSDCFDKIDNLNEAGSIRSMHKYKSVFASNFKQVNIAINTSYQTYLNYCRNTIFFSTVLFSAKIDLF